MSAAPDRCCCGGDDDHGHLVGCPAVERCGSRRVLGIDGGGMSLGLVWIGVDWGRSPDLVWPPRGTEASR